MGAGVENVLTTIAACIGVGAFVDFYIGKDGQKRVKDRLETWWYRLSDIPIVAVGREEALNALRAIDYLFGPKLFSLKRLKSVAIFKLASLVLYPGLFFVIAIYYGISVRQYYQIIAYLILFDIVLISLSISISRAIVGLAIRSMRTNYLINAALIVIFIIVQCAVLFYLSEAVTTIIVLAASDAVIAIAYSNNGLNLYSYVSEVAKGTWLIWTTILYPSLAESPFRNFDNLYSRLVLNPFVVDPIFGKGAPSFLKSLWPIDSIKLNAVVINVGRLFLALAFFGSYLLVPVWPRILTLYARVIESDKPVFTLVGAGIGGFASAISALLK